MAYDLRAVVAPARALEHYGPGVAVPLGQGLALVPMTPARAAADRTDERFGAFFPLGFDASLAAWSADDPVAYVEADYFGGMGLQYATVWHRGDVVLGPLFKDEDDPLPAEGSPISQALRRLGATAQGHDDEFDAVGLGRHRSVERWA
ncbi:hypothetical protein Aab01nite_12730 [Paractinoplanes abujensis]|uniref:Uncharacterized protein n=1 Tax=Paractinoplanes abujensis TaxID=882441 RepID=A0A7W7CPM1_9ACTN|nr:hypothetical protein [Actinoplanes abujensis]MBB4690903.1 hypothetical protein [Actinoplanes abujensis]GID17683.1 hypothetical protein Aab01nite_12730 [Actinoplanes abujensis]